MPPLIVTGRMGACGNTKRQARSPSPDEFGHDRHEVVAVRAQPMQPDDGGIRCRGGFDLDGLERHGRSR